MQESIVFLVRVQCRSKESSRSLSHLLVSFLYIIVWNYKFRFFLLNAACITTATTTVTRYSKWPRNTSISGANVHRLIDTVIMWYNIFADYCFLILHCVIIFIVFCVTYCNYTIYCIYAVIAFTWLAPAECCALASNRYEFQWLMLQAFEEMENKLHYFTAYVICPCVRLCEKM